MYDMHGNVFEWCQDWYGNYPGGSVTDPTGLVTDLIRVIRGGSWFNDAGACRSASRGRDLPTMGNFSVGFRVVLAPVQ